MSRNDVWKIVAGLAVVLLVLVIMVPHFGIGSKDPAKAKQLNVRKGLSNVRSIATDGGESYCATLTSGTAVCWGDDYDGQLGNGHLDRLEAPTNTPAGRGKSDDNQGYDTPQRVAGLTNIASIVGGRGWGYCALLTNRKVDCWGYNAKGVLGNGHFGGPEGQFRSDFDTPQPVSGLTNVASLASSGGEEGSACAVLTNGNVECWGDDSFGQLGNGTVGGPDGASDYDTPQPVSGLTNAASITGGSDGYCVVLRGGTADCWGDNGSGELGNGHAGGPMSCGVTYSWQGSNQVLTGCDDIAQPVSGLKDAVSIVNGPVDQGVDDDGGYSYCALLATGHAECWGSNVSGELGNGQVGGPDGHAGFDTSQDVLGLINVVSIAGDCALLKGGGVECWGGNPVGEGGTGHPGVPGATPEPVAGLTDVASIIGLADPPKSSAAYCAVLTNGKADCWGDNVWGELGNGHLADEGTKTPGPISQLTGITSIVGSNESSACAVLANGRVACWGLNDSGELGNGHFGGPDGYAGFATPQQVDAAV